MTGLDLLLAAHTAGVRFTLEGSERAVAAIFPGAWTARERVLLAAIKCELRALLLIELPADPGEGVCAAFDAPEGVAVCRRCARGLGAHFWRRTSLRSNGCDFAIGSADEPCRRCGVPAAEHLDANSSAPQ